MKENNSDSALVILRQIFPAYKQWLISEIHNLKFLKKS